jgi:hypothetical protein
MIMTQWRGLADGDGLGIGVAHFGAGFCRCEHQMRAKGAPETERVNDFGTPGVISLVSKRV